METINTEQENLQSAGYTLNDLERLERQFKLRQAILSSGENTTSAASPKAEFLSNVVFEDFRRLPFSPSNR